MANILGESRFLLFLYNLTLFKRLMLSLTLFLAVWLSYYRIFLGPLGAELNEKRFLLNDMCKKDKTLSLVIANKDLILKEASNLEINIFKSKKLNIISDLTNCALENTEFKVLSKIKKDSYKKKIYELNLRGGFNDFVSFLNNNLINHPLLKIKQIDIKNINKKELVFGLNLRLIKYLDEKNK